MSLHYAVNGAIDDVAIPQNCMRDRKDELWKKTCFEAFISDGVAYYEFNFSPSTQWAAYRFDDYRAGLERPEITTPEITTARTAHRFDLYAEILIDALQLPGPPPRRLGLSAVIRDHDGGTSYWALSHGAGAPDFHRASCFALQIP